MLSSLEPIAAPRVRQRYEQVAEHLARDVLLGRFLAGARLPSERELAARFGVGRASVREALASLQVRGVLETRRGAGSFVAADAVERLQGPEAALLSADPGDDADTSPSALLEARLVLEPAIVRLAAQAGRRDARAEELLAEMLDAGDPEDPADRARWNDADRHFHRRLATMAANPVLTATADYVAALMDQPLWQRVRDESIAVAGRMAVHVAEHQMIYEAVVAREPEAAEFYVRQHLQRVRRYMTLD